MAVAADRQSHEDQEYSSPPVHCKRNDPGTFVFVSVLILAIIQDQALVASKHLLIETEDKTPLKTPHSLARRGHGRDFADDGADYPESDSSGIDYKVNYRHIGEGIDYMAKKKIMG